MATTDGDEVATRDDVTGIVHMRLRLEDSDPPQYAVFHRNVGPNPFTVVDASTVAEADWCPLCVNRHPGR